MASKDSSANAQEGQAVSKAQIDAILVMIKAIHLAQSRGAWSLDEAKNLSEAVSNFVIKQENGSSNNALTENSKPSQPDFSKLRVES